MISTHKHIMVKNQSFSSSRQFIINTKYVCTHEDICNTYGINDTNLEPSNKNITLLITKGDTKTVGMNNSSDQIAYAQ